MPNSVAASDQAGAKYCHEPSAAVSVVVGVPGSKLEVAFSSRRMNGSLSRSAEVNSALCDNPALKGHNASQPSSSTTVHTSSIARRIGFTSIVAATLIVAAGCAPSLAVAPRLIASWPMPDATLPIARQTFELHFNRTLDPSASSAEVIDDDGSVVASALTISQNDPRRLSIRVQEPRAGTFELH